MTLDQIRLFIILDLTNHQNTIEYPHIMKNIAHKAIVLKLNRNWRPVGVELVSKSICDLMTGVILAMNIVYELNPDGTPNFDKQEYVNPVDWDAWMKLPVREWDLSIHSTHMHLRVPTVVIHGSSVHLLAHMASRSSRQSTNPPELWQRNCI